MSASIYPTMSTYQLSQAISALAAAHTVFDQMGAAWSHSESGEAIEEWADQRRDELSEEINKICRELASRNPTDTDDLNYRREAFAKAYTYLERDLFHAVTVGILIEKVGKEAAHAA